MRNFLSILLLMIYAVIVLSCSNAADSDDKGATFSILLYDGLAKASHEGVFPTTDQGGTIFTVRHGRVNVRNFQFDLPVGETDSTNQVVLNGPFVMDLVHNESNPDIGVFDLPAGIYKRIDVRFDDAKTEDGLVSNSDELMDNTMVVEGTFEYNGIENREFTFIFKFNEDITFEEPEGITVSEDKKRKFLVNLLVEPWLADINITDCLDNGNILLDNNGNLLINEENGNGDCGNFMETIKINIKNNYELN